MDEMAGRTTTNDNDEGEGDDREGRSTRDGGGGTTPNNVRRRPGGPGSMTPGDTHPRCKMRKTVGEGVGYDSEGTKPPATTADCWSQVCSGTTSPSRLREFFFFYFFSSNKPPLQRGWIN
jgi:hypothetical protein